MNRIHYFIWGMSMLICSIVFYFYGRVVGRINAGGEIIPIMNPEKKEIPCQVKNCKGILVQDEDYIDMANCNLCRQAHCLNVEKEQS